jgi:hypothetical protein
MLYMIINRTRAGLTESDMEALGRIAQAFYDHVPPGVELHGDWTALDYSCTFALLETDSPDLLETIQAPFRDYVDMEAVPVMPVTGWGKR